MSALSNDTKAVVRAAEAMTTQLRRIADALATPTVSIADGPPTTPDDGPRPKPMDPVHILGIEPETLAADMLERFGQLEAEAAEVKADQPAEPPEQRRSRMATALLREAEEARRSPAADEEQLLRWARRETLLNLITRVQHGRTLTEDEARILREHVETELREAEAARRSTERAEEAARRALEQRQEMAEERYAWQERGDQAERERDQQAAVLAEVLRHFTEHGHPGAPCVRTPWLRTETVDRWRSVVQHDVERPWWQQLDTARGELAEAQAVIKQVHALHQPQPGGSGFPDSQQCRTCSEDGGDGYLYLMPWPCPTTRALDGTEQPTTTPQQGGSTS